MLLVDLDPQACLTFSLGIDPEDLELSVHHVLTKGLDAAEVIIETDDGVDLLPGHHRAGPRRGRPADPHRPRARRQGCALRGRRDYDWVLLDCPPSLGVLTVAALTAAEGVLIPLQCETLSHRGVGQLLDTVHDVRRFTNRELEVWGVLPTLYDGRTNHARAVLENISETYHLDVIEPPIPKSIRFAEAPAAGRSILSTTRSHRGADAYRDVAASLTRREPVAVYAAAMPRRRKVRGASRAAASTRPRYARIAAAAGALLVTLVAVLGGLGVLPRPSRPPPSRSRPSADAPARRDAATPAATGGGSIALSDGTVSAGPATADRTSAPTVARRTAAAGRRVVFAHRPRSASGWWAGRPAATSCVRTYLVSGQHHRQPAARDLRGLLQVDAARGASTTPAPCATWSGSRTAGNAAIGFHDIPLLDGDRGADPRPARHAAVARVHPPVAARRARAVELRPARARRSSSSPEPATGGPCTPPGDGGAA